MNKKLRYPLNFLFNIFVIIANLFIRRDQHVVIVGAWMGDRFADNSRFLYQYLFEEKNNLNLTRVIWITRNPRVFSMLKDMGYDVLMAGTGESFYWHLKAGIHIICNSSLDFMPIKADIETRFSWGAIKVQLWHGVGMKSVGKDANKEKEKDRNRLSWMVNVANSIKSSAIVSSGGWRSCLFLSSSKYNGEVNIRIAGCKDENLLYSCYPRDCGCLRLTNEESRVVNKLKCWRKVVLFLPTFRDLNAKYSHPLSCSRLADLIVQEDILWVEKAHPSSKIKYEKIDIGENILQLKDDFDVNVLYPYISVLLSDYSSACFDAVHRNIPLVMYVPDYDDFKSGTVGFLFDVKKLCHRFMQPTIDEVVISLKEILDSPNIFLIGSRTDYNKINHIFWSGIEPSYERFWNDFLKKIQMN